MAVLTRLPTIVLLLAGLVACTGAPPVEPAAASRALDPAQPPVKANQEQADSTAAPACPLSEPSWLKPPEDSAVLNPPDFGHYFVNEDRSIWASAWWIGQEEEYLRASEEGIKVGWFRPAGAELEITGRRIDGDAPALEADIPCCYPTRFQATGLSFPTAGCWEVTARAAESELSFVVSVAP